MLSSSVEKQCLFKLGHVLAIVLFQTGVGFTTDNRLCYSIFDRGKWTRRIGSCQSTYCCML